MNWDQTKEKMLAEAASEARKHAYAPYSGFSVGAALLTEQGTIYTGCNVENAAFTPGCCAERTAFFKAVSEGEQSFAGIAIVGGKNGEDPSALCPPCGVCRQVMQEFCDPQTFRIILPGSGEKWKVCTLAELLPLGFGGHGRI